MTSMPLRDISLFVKVVGQGYPLVLAGVYDFLFPPEHQAILADRLSIARLELIERAGHNPHDEQSELVVQIIRKFLAVVGT
jgi:pimeloyl-ACP methyl ester carboxylesterase